MRDWLDTTIGTVAHNIARWFQQQHITAPSPDDPTGEHPDPLGLWTLAAATVRDARSELLAATPQMLFRAALTGTPLPLSVAYQAVRRCRAEQRVTRPRAALIKLVLLTREPNHQEDHMANLDAEHPSPAYHCGRLLAVLESAQRQALGKINTTIVDRFYGAASATPATVFGSLLRGATTAHLPKLHAGARHAVQNRIGEVCGQIDAFPKTLSLQDQALFSLGYYHQQQHDKAQAIAKRSTRDPKPASDTPAASTERGSTPPSHKESLQ